MTLRVEELPPSAQAQIKALLPSRRRRSSQKVSQEELLGLAARVLLVVNELNLAQKRTVLNFTLQMIDRAQGRWWRKPSNPKKEKGA